MLKIFFIAAGGAVGAVLRYWISGLSYRYFPTVFPLGTLIVNLLGALLIGLLWGLFETIVVPQNVRVFVFVGVLGAFTTFSTFSLENFHLLKDGEHVFFIMNLMLSVALSLGLVFSGYFVARYTLNIVR